LIRRSNFSRVDFFEEDESLFCVVQEVALKRPNKYGACKKIEVHQNQWRLDNKPYTWGWRYSSERFERPHMEAYKISLHHSFREDGKAKKKQYSVATISYYGFLDYGLYDCVDSKLESIAAETGIEFNVLYDIVEKKLAPLIDRISSEFKESEEYKTKKKHEEILEAYRKAKGAFAKKYGVDDVEYDRCYDIYGNLRNKEYLEQLTRNQQRQQEYQRSYREYYFGNYRSSGGRSSSYCSTVSSTYTDKEKKMLKQFYRALTKQFHPDINHDRDTTEHMKLLNKLAEEWGLKQ